MPPQPIPTDPMSPPQGMPPMGGLGGMPPPQSSTPPELPPMMGDPAGMPPAPMPEMPPADMSMESPVEPKSDGKTMEQKKQVLQKLMNSLLNKPGRSLHELMNGIKDAMGAYKSYAKEVDALSGITTDSSSMSSGAPSGGSSSEIQKILQGIQQKKAPAADGAGGPGMQYQTPTVVPPTPQPIPPQDAFIAGQPQTSSFNRPAPVNQFGVFGY